MEYALLDLVAYSFLPIYMLHKPKFKIARRLGAPVFEKTQTQKFAANQTKRAATSKRPKGLTDYGKQVLEKQKAKAIYGLRERQFAKYVETAIAKKGNTTEKLLGRLESRLDNVVMRAGLSKTRAGARQLVSHGHINVNNKRVSIPSYEVKVGDVITIRESSKNIGAFAQVGELMKAVKHPAWLTADIEKFVFTVAHPPAVGTSELMFNPATVLEFYTR